MENGRAILGARVIGQNTVLTAWAWWVLGMALERREIRFSGCVQGVGFRYTTKRLAAGFDVSGHVKNLSNGQVQLIVEGATAEIDGFLQSLQSELRGNIRDMQVDRTDYQGAFDNFDISY